MMPTPKHMEDAPRTRPETGGMWRAWVGEQREPNAVKEQAVEWALMVADDADCLTDMAVILRGTLRPDLTVEQVQARLEQLMDAATAAAQAETHGSRRTFEWHSDEYVAALQDFARGAR